MQARQITQITGSQTKERLVVCGFKLLFGKNKKISWLRNPSIRQSTKQNVIIGICNQ